MRQRWEPSVSQTLGHEESYIQDCWFTYHQQIWRLGASPEENLGLRAEEVKTLVDMNKFVISLNPV